MKWSSFYAPLFLNAGSWWEIVTSNLLPEVAVNEA